MKILLLLAVIFSGSLALAASETCRDRVQKAHELVAKVEQDFAEGNATRMDILDAKLSRTEDLYDCTPFVKYNYCRYRQILLNSRIAGEKALIEAGKSTEAALTPIEDALKATIYYCTHPGASWKPATPTP